MRSSVFYDSGLSGNLTYRFEGLPALTSVVSNVRKVHSRRKLSKWRFA